MTAVGSGVLPSYVRTLGGRTIPLLPADSFVAVLVTTAECDQSRLAVPALTRLQTRLRAGGISIRTIIRSEDVAARQYARLLPEPEMAIGGAGQLAARSLRVSGVPSLLLLDRDGAVRGRWSPLSMHEADAEAVAAQVLAIVSGSGNTPPLSMRPWRARADGPSSI